MFTMGILPLLTASMNYVKAGLFFTSHIRNQHVDFFLTLNHTLILNRTNFQKAFLQTTIFVEILLADILGILCVLALQAEKD